LVSFVTLPLTTKVLGPQSYGVLALGSALAGVGAYIATLGMSFVTASRWPEADRVERRRIVGTLLTIGVAVVLVWALIVAGSFAVLHTRVDFLRAITWPELLLMLGGLIFSPGWTITADIATVEGKATMFAAVNIVSAIVSAAATLIALFVFDALTISLFVGIFASSTVGLVAFFWYLGGYITLTYDPHVRRELAQTTFVVAQIAETVQSLVERVLLSRYVGYASLGLFSHSRRYRDFANQATGSVTRGVWPVTLGEARDPHNTFAATGRTWRTVYVWLTACGIGATAIGDRFISALTHDKFTPAWTYLAPWFVLLLVQLSAKPELGTLYAFGRSHTMGRISLFSNVLGIVGSASLIPWLGTGGALTALALQWLSYRVAVRIPARRLRRIPFQDGWAVAGCVVLLALYGVKLIAGRGAGVELALLFGGEVLWLGAAALLSRDVFDLLPKGRASAARVQSLDAAP